MAVGERVDFEEQVKERLPSRLRRLWERVDSSVAGFLEAFGAGYISAGYRDAISFLIMLLVLLVRPAGLFGWASAGRV